MSQTNLPQWRSPEHLRQILLSQPENKHNRALYTLSTQFDYDHTAAPSAAAIHLAALHQLWHDPRFQALENIKEWLFIVLCDSPAHWLALQGDILQLADALHPETCRTYGDFGGMHQSAQTLQPFVAKLFAHGSSATLGMARDCLYWNEDLRRQRPDWNKWFAGQTAQIHRR